MSISGKILDVMNILSRHPVVRRIRGSGGKSVEKSEVKSDEKSGELA